MYEFGDRYAGTGEAVDLGEKAHFYIYYDFNSNDSYVWSQEANLSSQNWTYTSGYIAGDWHQWDVGSQDYIHLLSDSSTLTTDDHNVENKPELFEHDEKTKEKLKKIENGEIEPVPHTHRVFDAEGNIVWEGPNDEFKPETLEKLNEEHDMIPDEPQDLSKFFN